MKTLTAGSNVLAEPVARTRWTLQRLLLACGIVSSLYYVATTFIGATQWEGYDPISQAVSELFAIGAPSRALVVPLLLIYTVLLYAFGVGVWMSAGGRAALRITGSLIFAKEIFGVIATVWTPIHVRGMPGTFSDTMHLMFTVAGVFLCMLPAMAFGAAALGRKFRIYTIVTIIVFVACAVWTFLDVPLIAANLPTPWSGLRERINIFSYMLWLMVLAIALLRRQASGLTAATGSRAMERGQASGEI